VVREANATLNNLPDPAPEIAFANVFWTFTFLTPLLYLYVGFRWKSLVLLVLSILGLLASLTTVRMYHSVMPLEWVLVLGGIATISVSVFLIQYFKNPKHGFSYTPNATAEGQLHLQSVVLSQITSNIQSADHGVNLGGGDFGGGGAEEKY
jgi:uncharacterized membrane protein YgcG